MEKYEESSEATELKRKYTDGPVPLVLFSGGLDSTYLLSQLLMETEVEVLYVRGPQGHDKERMEDLARSNILDWMAEHRPYRVREINSFRLPIGMVTNDDVAFQQVLPWLYAALCTVNGKRHSKVVISYVLGDQISQELGNLQAAWTSLVAATHHRGAPLEFPLSYVSKQTILEELPESLYEHVWYCELPDDGLPCGKCPACITHESELHKRALKNAFTLPGGNRVLKMLDGKELSVYNRLQEAIVAGLEEKSNEYKDLTIELNYSDLRPYLRLGVKWQDDSRRIIDVAYEIFHNASVEVAGMILPATHRHQFTVSGKLRDPRGSSTMFDFEQDKLNIGINTVVNEVLLLLGQKLVITMGKKPLSDYEIHDHYLEYVKRSEGKESFLRVLYSEDSDFAERLRMMETRVGPATMSAWIAKAFETGVIKADWPVPDVINHILGNTFMKV